MTYRPRTRAVLDLATGGRVCARCYADITERPKTAVFCSKECRGQAGAKDRRVRARKGIKPWLYQ